MIYQHEARSAAHMITSAVDAHIEARARRRAGRRRGRNPQDVIRTATQLAYAARTPTKLRTL